MPNSGGLNKAVYFWFLGVSLIAIDWRALRIILGQCPILGWVMKM